MKKIFIKTELIKSYIKENNLTIKQFCKKCDIKYYNYLQIIKCDGNLKGNVLYKISKITSINLDELFGISRT